MIFVHLLGQSLGHLHAPILYCPTFMEHVSLCGIFPVTKKVFDNLSSVHYLNCTRVLETQTCAGESCRFFRRNVLVQGLRLDPSVTPNRTGSSTWRREQRQSSKHIEFVFYIRNDGSCPEIQQWEIVYSCDGLNTQRNVIILITVLPKLMYYLAWTIISSNS